MGYLGFRVPSRVFLGTATFQNQIVSGAWIAQFDPSTMPVDADYEVWHGAARGPGGFFEVWIDDHLYGVGLNGFRNEYAPAGGAMYVRKGEQITCHWSVATTPAPRVWLYLREPEVGRL